MKERTALLALLVVAGGLLVAWAFVVPIFESPDEPHHWQYARYLYDQRRLPPFNASFVEGNSPPLYYALIAPVAVASHLPPGLVWQDAFGKLIVPFPPRFTHTAGGDFSRYWPLRQARLITAWLALWAVVFSYLAARELTGRPTTALLAGALVAFLPQFTFRGATISNDALVATLAAVSTYFMVRIVRRGFTWTVGVLASVALAGAYLSKINAICLAPGLILSLVMAPGFWRARLMRLSVLGVALALVAPWSARNVTLYGDPFASEAMLTAVAELVSKKPLTSSYFWTVFPSWLARSFVGVFGWFTVWLPEWVYLGYWMLGLLGLGGAARLSVRGETDRRIVLVLAVVATLALAVVVHINRTFDQPQGRYLFPGLPALAVLVAVGLEGLPGWRGARAPAAATVASALAIANALILWWIVVPAYYPPLTASLSTRSVELTAATPTGLAPAGHRAWRAAGDSPHLSFVAAVPAADAGFLQFELGGRALGHATEGRVVITRNNQSRNDGHEVTFRWRPDGVPQRIIVPILDRSTPPVEVTAIRIDPWTVVPDQSAEPIVRIDHVRVRGSLDR